MGRGRGGGSGAYNVALGALKAVDVRRDVESGSTDTCRAPSRDNPVPLHALRSGVGWERGTPVI